MRSCDSPAPENGGAECQGGDVEIQACNIQGCPVDGGWTDFGSWSHCTVECGGGTMTKYRTCENPAPENGGAECQGEESKSIGCHEYACESDIGCWPKEDRANKGYAYEGSQSKTKSGYTCQEWSSQSPHRHMYTAFHYPGKGLDHNYCRNPAEKYHETWCYTTDPSKRWDWCVVPDCADELKFISATQKTTGWGGVAKLAIDGNTNGFYSSKTCTHSTDHEQNWWNGKLSERASVSKVIIHNRLDSVSNRINNVQVYVAGTYCGAITYETGKVVYEVDCGGAIGDYIKVTQNGDYLTLCEVQAIGVSSPNQ